MWLATLGGGAPDDGAASHAEAAREALLLRRALREWTPAIDPVAADDPERIAKLVARAKGEGLFGDRRAIGAQDWRRAPEEQGLTGRLRAWWTTGAMPHFRPRRSWAMAVAVIAIVALTYVMRAANEGTIDDATVRSAPDAVTLMRARDPEALRREIITALARQGVKANTYSRFGRAGIDADLPRPLSAEIKSVLDRYRIPAPDDGVLRVEIEAERR